MTEQQTGETLLQAIEIRQIRPEDAEAVNHLYRETWLETYPNEAAGITYDDVDELTASWITLEENACKAEAYGHLGADTFNGVAVVGDEIAGNSRAVRLGDGLTYRGEPYNHLKTIYVLSKYQGRGVASKLFEAALDFLGTDKQVLLEVATYNERAINFYRKYGFEITEKGRPRPDVCGLPSGVVLPEYIMVRPAQPAA